MRASRVPASVAPLHAFVRRRRRLSWLQALGLVATMTGVVVLVAAAASRKMRTPRYAGGPDRRVRSPAAS
jgi:drug/metabolite transporter (DMT)-like permease